MHLNKYKYLMWTHLKKLIVIKYLFNLSLLRYILDFLIFYSLNNRIKC